MQILFFVSITFVLCTLQVSFSEKILALFPYPVGSHFAVFKGLLTELALRGHNITVFTSFPQINPVPNYYQRDTKGCFQLPMSRFGIDFAIKNRGTPFATLNTFSIVINGHEDILRCSVMQELMHSNETFDLMMTELFVSDALLPFSRKFKIPYIMFASMPVVPPWVSGRLGSIDNPSYIPSTLIDRTFRPGNTTFFDRLYNSALYLATHFHSHVYWKPKTNEIIRQFFGESFTPVDEIARNVSLVLIFGHFSLQGPKPQVPAVIEVGGIHIGKAAPLPKDVEIFLNQSANGVVYFCLGSLMQAHTMNPEMRNAFVNAFRQIPHQVLWKWEVDEFPDKPTNVMIKKWMPQRDILAHPNIKLFITHGGALGINEAAYEGVPILGIPLYADQFSNIKAMELAGAGEMLRHTDITAENLLEKMRIILNDKRYMENAKKLSSIYKDRPMSPMDSAVYWTEYVIRHKGASHLRSAAVELAWYEYLLLDVILFLMTVTILIVFIIIKILSFSYRWVKTKFSTKTKSKQN